MGNFKVGDRVEILAGAPMTGVVMEIRVDTCRECSYTRIRVKPDDWSLSYWYDPHELRLAAPKVTVAGEIKLNDRVKNTRGQLGTVTGITWADDRCITANVKLDCGRSMLYSAHELRLVPPTIEPLGKQFTSAWATFENFSFKFADADREAKRRILESYGVFGKPIIVGQDIAKGLWVRVNGDGTFTVIDKKEQTMATQTKVTKVEFDGFRGWIYHFADGTSERLSGHAHYAIAEHYKSDAKGKERARCLAVVEKCAGHWRDRVYSGQALDEINAEIKAGDAGERKAAEEAKAKAERERKIDKLARATVRLGYSFTAARKTIETLPAAALEAALATVKL